MYENNKVLAIIPARGGSKGLPEKNIKDLFGKPLIGWSIEQAYGSKYIDEIIVSTDDKKIADIAVQYKAKVPYLRPKKLALDETPTFDVVEELLENLRKREGDLAEYLILLQPTSPLKTSEDIDKAFELFIKYKQTKALVSISGVDENPYQMKILDEAGYIRNFMTNGLDNRRRQDLPIVYKPNGAIYIMKTKVLLEERTFFPDKTIGYIMPKERSIDIDDSIDFKLAEIIISNG